MHFLKRLAQFIAKVASPKAVEIYHYVNDLDAEMRSDFSAMVMWDDWDRDPSAYKHIPCLAVLHPNNSDLEWVTSQKPRASNAYFPAFMPACDMFIGRKGAYQEAVARTHAPLTREMVNRFTDNHRLVHNAFGVASESGELVDAIKKHVFYGRPLDVENVIEELGDLMWYITDTCEALNITLESVQEKNTAKLKKRYPDQFTEEAAQARADKEEPK